MQNAGLEQIEIKIKIDSKNVNKPRYADSITSLPGCGKELRNMLLKMKEESTKCNLLINILKTLRYVKRQCQSYATRLVIVNLLSTKCQKFRKCLT